MTPTRLTLLVVLGGFAAVGLPGSSAQPAPGAAALPDGAVRRLGTTHLRSGRPILGLAVLPGGGHVATAAADGITVWNLETGAPTATANYPPPPKTVGFGRPAQLSGRFVVRTPNGILTPSPDGKGLVVLHKNEVLRYALPLDEKPPTTLTYPTYRGSPGAVAFAAPDPTPLALDTSGRLFYWRDGAPPARATWLELQQPPVAGNRLALAAGGGVTAHGGEDGRVRLGDAAARKDLGSVDADGGVRALAVSADGKWVAASSALPGFGRGATVQLWQVADRKEVGRMDGVLASTLALSRNGSLLAALVLSDDRVDLYEPTTGKRLRSLTAPGDDLHYLEFLPDGARIVAAGKSGTVHVWDTGTGERCGPTAGHAIGVVGVHLVPGGGVVSVEAGGEVIAWDAAGRPTRRFTAHPKGATASTLSPDGKTLFTGGGGVDGSIRAWDYATGVENRAWKSAEESPRRVESLAVSPDGTVVAAGILGRGIVLLDAATLKQTGVLKPNADEKDRPSTGDGRAEALGFTPAGRLVSQDATRLFVWDPRRGSMEHRIAGGAGGFGIKAAQPGLTILPGGKRFAAPAGPPPREKGRPLAPKSNYLGIWDADTGDLVERIDLGPQAVPTAVAAVPGGNAIAVGDHAGTVWLVEPGGKAEPQPLRGHRGPVASLAASADGKTLASGGADTTVLLWHLDRK
ncbi:MAG TPA: WD40 repeat domain-containing protein [Urbifossiella sp.]|jgi:WD40 repeat protein|nr:WD40 repeat domain-containing protein [Urbifossiella sp.]